MSGLAEPMNVLRCIPSPETLSPVIRAIGVKIGGFKESKENWLFVRSQRLPRARTRPLPLP